MQTFHNKVAINNNNNNKFRQDINKNINKLTKIPFANNLAII